MNNSGIGANVRPLFFEKRKDAVVNDPVLDRAYSRIDVLFDSTGGISSVRTYVGDWDDGSNDGGVVNRVITGPLQLFVSPSDIDANGGSPLFDETNLWVTINNTSGGVNIGYNNPPLNAGGTTFANLVTEARRDATTAVSASQ